MEAGYYELRCARCGASELCGVEAMARRLTQVGRWRRQSPPDAALLAELFKAASAQFPCARCGHAGLIVAPAEEGDGWPGPRYCDGCRKPIAAERVEAMPEVRLCAACQRADERGDSPGAVEYCPRCGSPMKLQLGRGPGLTRYKMTCGGSPPCRGK